MRVSIIIPTYNERKNIVPLIQDLVKISKEHKLNFEIIIVDDNSPDKTAEAVSELRNKNKKLRNKLHLINRPRKEGLGKAYFEAFKYVLNTKTDYVITMDADFSHNPQDILRLLEKVRGFDVVVGSRYINGGNMLEIPSKKIISKIAISLARGMLNLKTHDVTTGFKCYSRRFIEYIKPNGIDASGYAFQFEMIKKAEEGGFKVAEVPIIFSARKQGVSKLTFKEAIDSAFTLFEIFWKEK